MIRIDIEKRTFTDVLKNHLKFIELSSNNILSGINFKTEKNKIIVCSTNGYILLRTVLNVPYIGDGINRTYSGAILNKINFVKSKGFNLLTITMDNKFMEIIDDAFMFTYKVPVLEGKYPQTETLFPNKKNYKEVWLNRDYLKCIPESDSRTKITKICFNPKNNNQCLLIEPHHSDNSEITQQTMLLMPIQK